METKGTDKMNATIDYSKLAQRLAATAAEDRSTLGQLIRQAVTCAQVLEVRGGAKRLSEAAKAIGLDGWSPANVSKRGTVGKHLIALRDSSGKVAESDREFRDRVMAMLQEANLSVSWLGLARVLGCEEVFLGKPRESKSTSAYERIGDLLPDLSVEELTKLQVLIENLLEDRKMKVAA